MNFTKLKEKWVYYEGAFYQDCKHGTGKIKLTNGEVFEGNFVFDVIDGEGRFSKRNGETLNGTWRTNLWQERTK